MRLNDRIFPGIEPHRFLHLKRLVSLIIVSSAFILAEAETPEGDRYPLQANLYGGLCLTEQPAWTIEPSIAWNFHKFFGVSLGLELTSQFGNSTRFTDIGEYMAELVDNQVNPAWFLIKPSVILKTPDIWHSTDRYFRLWLQVEPGISIGTPFHNSLTYKYTLNPGEALEINAYRTFKNEGLQWFNFNARAAVNLSIDRYVIGAGYSISSLDYYSGRRNVTLANGTKFHVPQQRPCQTIFLSIGYIFGSLQQPKPKFTASPTDFLL